MMAKKQMDFKPDPQGAGLLSRLYITQRQRRQLLRWGLYGLVTLFLLVLQDVIFSRMHIAGATTDLVPAVLLMICVLRGPESGGVFTLLGSMVYLFAGSSPGPMVLPVLTALGVTAAAFRGGFLQKGMGSTVICAGTGMVLYELCVFLLGRIQGLTTPSRLGVFLLTGLLSGAVMPLLYPLLAVIDKIGGEAWKE